MIGGSRKDSREENLIETDRWWTSLSRAWVASFYACATSRFLLRNHEASSKYSVFNMIFNQEDNFIRIF